ncbi:PP2C family protein-serine/threonine phosphatase [Streptacidiphilus fuscans]|uniref:Serine/threonine-protein phosphatase n=1 Tax=Streptacidiphilus fuscans TaxID=2789292 RepID=A0A931B5M0_9ACTN|nr:PP2C family protein-serine/threonine phosphatase [Streptacidiphilus fuscans]MBF9070824.1 serine/threonine-protein phosphatase [Streptacidiphilus fuscans]
MAEHPTTLGLPAPTSPAETISGEPIAALRERSADDPLADLTTLYDLTDRLSGAPDLEAALTGLLADGAALIGARRGMLLLTQPSTTLGLGLDRSALGALETVPAAQILRAAGGEPTGDRFREVALQLGIGASYAQPLADLGSVVWFYDTPTQPSEREQRLAGLYCASAARLLAKELERDRLRRTADALRRGLLPGALPRVGGMQLAARCVAAGLENAGGCDWYDAISLPEGALALSVGSVTGGGADSAAAMGRLRAALRAYAVLEGEDPVAVLGDLELLLKSTEPARTATALYAFVEPSARRLSLAGAGQCPPLLVTSFGASFVETSLSAPLGMLSCWEAPGVELRADRGDVLLLYTDGLARRCGEESLHAGQTRLRAAAAEAPRDVRQDPERFCAYLLDACLGSSEPLPGADDVVLLAARFD